MKPDAKSPRKNILSPEKEALAAEWAAHLPGWAEKADGLAAQLQISPPEEREAFFARLFTGAENRVVPLLEALRGVDEKLDTDLIRGCGHAASPWAVDFLAAWAGKKPSKNIHKEIRKSLFRLRSKGIPVPDLADSSPGMFRSSQTPPAEAYVSLLDASGTRLALIGRPQAPQGRIVFHAALSDTEGILDFIGFESSAKRFHELRERMRRDAFGEIADADPEYVEALIREADEIHTRQGKKSHPEYGKWKSLLGPAAAPPLRPLIYRYLDEEEIQSRSDLLERSPALFETSSFRLWLLAKEEVAKCRELLEQAAGSRILLAPHQQESRFFEIYRQTVQELFTPGRRLLFRRRLEEMAYILWKKGDESGAKISLAAGLALSSEDKLLSPHPFLMEFVKRTVLALRDEEQREKEKPKGGGLIYQV